MPLLSANDIHAHGIAFLFLIVVNQELIVIFFAFREMFRLNQKRFNGSDSAETPKYDDGKVFSFEFYAVLYGRVLVKDERIVREQKA